MKHGDAFQINDLNPYFVDIQPEGKVIIQAKKHYIYKTVIIPH